MSCSYLIGRYVFRQHSSIFVTICQHSTLTFDNRAHESSATNDYSPLSRNRESSKSSKRTSLKPSANQVKSDHSVPGRTKNVSWIALQINPELCYIENFMFINTTSLVFFPRSFLDIDCEKEPESDGWMGQEECF